MAKKSTKKITIVGLLILIVAVLGTFYFKDESRLKSVKVDDPSKYAETKMKDDDVCNSKIDALKLNFEKTDEENEYELSCQPTGNAVKDITGSDNVAVSFKIVSTGLKAEGSSGDFACTSKGNSMKFKLTGKMDGSYLELIPQQSFQGSKKADGSYYTCMAKKERGYGYVMFQPVESNGGLFDGTIDTSNAINDSINLEGYGIGSASSVEKDDENEHVDRIKNSRVTSNTTVSKDLVQINPYLQKSSTDYENYGNKETSATFAEYLKAYEDMKKSNPEKTFSSILGENDTSVKNVVDGNGTKVSGKINLACNYSLSQDDIEKIIKNNFNDTYLDESGKLSNYYYDDYNASNPDENSIFNTTYFYGEKTISKSNKYYVHINTGDSNNTKKTEAGQATCKRVCKEVVKVDYGPPVAVKAGMCFEYRVKVSSIVQCESSTEGSTEPKIPSTCLPTPTCWSTALKKEMKVAGPTEDYQKCVEDCDGGKYTDKCSNSCYNKVYGEETDKVSATSTIDPTFLAASNINRNSTLGNCVEGQYYRNGTKLNWCEFGYQPEMSGNWNLPASEVKSSSGREKLYIRSGIFYGKTNFSWITYSGTYQTTVNKAFRTGGTAGILRGRYSQKGKVDECHDKCSWLNKNAYDGSSCEGKYLYFDYSYYRNRCNLLGDATLTAQCLQETTIPTYSELTGVTKAEFEYADTPVPNSEKLRELDAAYNAKIKEITLKECEAATTCNQTDSTYVIHFNYATKDSTQVEWVPPFSKPNTQTLTKGHDNIKSQGNILLSYGGCYADTNSNNRWYQSEWTIPGTWLSYKGKISFDDHSKDTNKWGYLKGKVCLPTNIVNTNQKWAIQFYKATEAVKNATYTTRWEDTFNNDYETKVKTDPTKAYTLSNNKYNGYNIYAESNDFGHFNWDFSVSCFWAYSDTNPTVDCEGNSCNEQCGSDGVECTCTGKDCTSKTTDEGYTVRSFDAEDPVLEGTGVEKKVLDNDRVIPFNWSKGAEMTYMKAGGYDVNPEEYLNDLKTKKDLFADEPDLIIKLSSQNIKEIRNYNKEHNKGGYTFEGKYNAKNGVIYYSNSSFIGDNKYMDIVKNSYTLGNNS